MRWSSTNSEVVASNKTTLGEILDIEKNMAKWVLNAPEPPSMLRQVVDNVKDTLLPHPNPKTFSYLRNQPFSKRAFALLQDLFPILPSLHNYNAQKFKCDFMAGLTLAIFAIPQCMGNATLARLNTGIVPPLIYAMLASSREIVIGPGSVDSLLLSSMIQTLKVPIHDSITYNQLVFTVTFFAGIFQVAFGLFRFGFLVEYLSDPTIVGFLAAAAVSIGLQQLKGLFGIVNFTNKTGLFSVVKSLWTSFKNQSAWHPYNLIIGFSFLCFILFTRFLGKRNKKLMWLSHVAPLLSVIVSSVVAYKINFNELQVKDYKVEVLGPIKGGSSNPSSLHQLTFDSQVVGHLIRIGLTIAIISLTGSIAVGRSFASLKGHSIDPNREVVSLGIMNIVGSLTSCYIASGSLSRTAVNYNAGSETMVSNIVMALTVLMSLKFLTGLLYFTPKAILAAIILSAVPGLIDLNKAREIWNVDKMDFLACTGAFLGVLFASAEIGLAIGITISFAKIIITSIQPATAVIGRLPGTDAFGDVEQYPMAVNIPGVLIVSLKSSWLCFANANLVEERIERWVNNAKAKEGRESTFTYVIIDASSLTNIDTAGIASLVELNKNLISRGVKLAIANPRWHVIHKLRLANFVSKIGGRIFLSVGEAVDACVGTKIMSTSFFTRQSSPKHFNMASSAMETCISEDLHMQVDIEKKAQDIRSQWVLNAPEPPSPWRVVADSVSKTISHYKHKLSSLTDQPCTTLLLSVLRVIFPILAWGRNYTATKFRKDLLAGLTIANTSVVPPLIYAVMGTSREIAIGPVAVVSLLLSSMMVKLVDPATDPVGYTKLILLATLFAGIFQTSFGLFRLGFLVDFLSHAAIVGFVAGAAIVIGLQQLKGLLGITHFTTKTDIVSVMKAVWEAVHNPGKRKKKLFWLASISPLVSVVLSTLIVFLTRADKNGVKIVKHVKGGLNPSSLHQLDFNNPYIGEVAKIGLVVAVVALTESIAVGRSFASIKGYQLDGNKEMMSIGLTNIIGSFTSCYVATGSFSRTAVNYAAGCETLVSNIVMAITVLISLQFLTKLLYYTPTAILASVILSALPGLIDVSEAYKIWKVDKIDFLACAGAFFGVLFASVEIGLLVAVLISFSKIILISIRPGTETLGKIPGTDLFCDVYQYPMAVKIPGVMIIRVKSALLCFANANFVRERIIKWVTEEESEDDKGNSRSTIQLVILDTSNLVNIDTSGITALEELHKSLSSQGKQLAIANPRWQVIHKLKVSNFVGKIGGRVFLTVEEAFEMACVKMLENTSIIVDPRFLLKAAECT
ncbi:Early nodulin-70 [Glycine max]|nr:Early nodulin-70 [Glycine max]